MLSYFKTLTETLSKGSIDAIVNKKTGFSCIDELVASGLPFDDICELAEKFLTIGVDINHQRGQKEETCLHIAAKQNDFRLVQFLLEKGALPTLGKTLPEKVATDVEVIALLKKNREDKKAKKDKEKRRKKKNSQMSNSQVETETEITEINDENTLIPIAIDKDKKDIKLSPKKSEINTINTVNISDLVQEAVNSLKVQIFEIPKPLYNTNTIEDKLLNHIKESTTKSEAISSNLKSEVELLDETGNNLNLTDIKPISKSTTVNFDANIQELKPSDSINWEEETLWEIETSKEARQQVIFFNFFF
jgi:ankyrin repeat protein